MHRNLILAIWSFVLINLLKDSTIIQPVKCFPEQNQVRQQQHILSNKEKDNPNKDSTIADIHPAAAMKLGKSIVKSPSLFTVDPEQRRRLQETCEEIECGAECYLARDQGCGWTDIDMKCIFDEFEVTESFEFSMGTCAECFLIQCGKECKELELRGCTWDGLFCELDPTGATDDSELDDGVCSNVIPFIQTIVFLPVIIISSLVGLACLIGFCVLIYCRILQNRNATHVGMTLAAPHLTYYPDQPVVLQTVQTQFLTHPVHDEIAVAVVVEEPYQSAIQPVQVQNKTVDV